MRSSIIVFFIFIKLFTFGILCSCAAEEPITQTDLNRKASESLETFKGIVTSDNYHLMGFESLDELSKVELGDPLQEFIVHSNDLFGYHPNSDPNKILSGGNRWIYPVLVDGKTRSSIELVQRDNSWKVASFGYPNRARLISNQLIQQSSQLKLSTDSFFVVHVPNNLIFLGHRINEELLLTPVLSYNQYALQIGVTKPANEIFPVLVSITETPNYPEK